MQAANIHDYRKNVLRKTQEQVARLAHCSQPLISAIEKGEMPSSFRIARIAHAYRLNEAKFVKLVNAARISGGK